MRRKWLSVSRREATKLLHYTALCSVICHQPELPESLKALLEHLRLMYCGLNKI
jgi:cyclic lactone autoinducer peptide